MDLNSNNYYSREADLKYWSSSQYKAFMRCQAKAMAELAGEWERADSIAMAKGRYLDERIELKTDKELQSWYSKHPEYFMKSGKMYADFNYAEEAYQRILKDEYFMDFITGEGVSHQEIRTFEISGVPFKAKFDSLFEDKIVDLKTTSSRGYYEGIWNSKTRKREHLIIAYGYHLQGALYQEAERQKTGVRKPFFIAQVILPTKDVKTDYDIILVDDSILYQALEEIKSNIGQLDLVKQGLLEPYRCEECDFCKSTKRLDSFKLLSEITGSDRL